MFHFSSLHPDVFWWNVARPVLKDILKNLFFGTQAARADVQTADCAKMDVAVRISFKKNYIFQNWYNVLFCMM